MDNEQSSVNSTRVKKQFPVTLRFPPNSPPIILDDGYLKNNIERIKEIDFISVDSDGFLLFEIKYQKPSIKSEIVTTVKVLPLKTSIPLKIEFEDEKTVNGYSLFQSNLPKSKGYGTEKSIYEYYRREQDQDYYAIIKIDGKKPKRIQLGSLLKPDSRIRLTGNTIYRNFTQEMVFNRKKLAPFLPTNLRNRRIMKSCLDILVAEGYLTRREIKTRSVLAEEFKTTPSLEKMFTTQGEINRFGVESVIPP